MKRLFWRSLASSLVFALATSASAATLRGDVKTEDGTPLPHIEIVLSGPDGDVSVVTGLGGRFTFSGLKPGEYRLAPAAPGLTAASPTTVTIGAADEHTSLVVAATGVAEQVIVSATRGVALASTLGIATTVLDGDAIEERRPSTLLHVLQDAPGVAVSRAGAPGRQASIFVRGGESNFSRLMIDGIVVNAPGGAYDYGDLLALDVERVEIVRGAGSSLYGTDALAGVVNIVTRDGGPSSLTAEAQGGSFDFWHGRAGASGRAGALDWRAGALHTRTDNGEPNSAFKETAGSGSAALRLSERSLLRGTLRITDSRVGTPGQTLYGRPDLDAYADRDDVIGGLSLEHVGGVVHRARLAFADTDLLSVNPEDSGPFTPTFEGRVAPFEFFDFPDPRGFRSDTRRASLGYQAEIQAGSSHLLTAGAEVERETGELGTPGAEAFITPERTNFGVYLQDRIALGTKAFLTLGGRVERNDNYGTRVVPRAAIAYRVRQSESATTLHASGGAGINEPNFFQTFGLPPFTRPNPDLKPERSRTFDAGIEQRIGSTARLDVTAFHHDYRDQIAFATVDPVTFEGAYFNLGRTRAKGIEAAAEVATSHGLSLRGAYTFLDGEIVDATGSFSPVYEKGKPLLRRPENQASFGARFNRGRLDTGANVVFVGRRADSDFAGLGFTENAGYTRVDARLGVDVTAMLRVFVAAENIFDREYQEVLGFPALGRSVRLGVSLRSPSAR